MISGNDERMAFVLTTEAHLEGVRQGRAEIRGIGTDTDALGNQLGAFSAKAQTAFDAMTAAEQKAFREFVGMKKGADDAAKAAEDHAKATDKDTQAIERSAVAMLKARDAARASITSPLAAMRRGDAGPMFGPNLPSGGLVAENARVAASFDPISTKARTAANAMSVLSFQAAGLTAGGQGTVIAMGSLATSLAHLTSSARLAASATGIGALVVVAGTLIPLLMKMGNETERVSGGFRRAFGGAGEEGAALFLRLANARRDAAEQAYANAPTFTMGGDVVAITKERKQLKEARDEAVKDQEAAIAADLSARSAARQKDREDAKRVAEQRVQDEIRAREIGEQARGRTLMLGQERTSPELAAVTAIQMEQARRERELDELTTLSKEEQAARRIDIARWSEAEINKIYDDAAEKRMDKADEEARRTEEIARRKAKRNLDIAKANVHAIVMAEGSMAQTLKRLALEPIVNRLEGIAAEQAVEVLRSAAAFDFRGAAMHAAASVAAIAAAREVAGWAGSGSKGGGGGAGSSGGGGSGAGSFEPRGSTEGTGSVVINLYSENAYGAEQIQQIQWGLERNGILKRGARIPPTNQLSVA